MDSITLIKSFRGIHGYFHTCPLFERYFKFTTCLKGTIIFTLKGLTTLRYIGLKGSVGLSLLTDLSHLKIIEATIVFEI